MKNNVYVYIIIMAITTYLIRVLPLTLIRKEISNTTIRSFLYYVPYVTLAVMTFPAILEATQTPVSAGAALLVALGLAWKGKSLFQVAVFSCIVVFVLELFLV
ncbi:MAG: AzlD domain-containing protein [Lachnospiraceae bacterium]